MNLDELRSALDTERQKGGLQGLRDSFYQEVAEFVEELKAERDRVAEQSEDPFGSPEVQQLTDKIDTARSTAESLYERRLGKLVKQASLAAADMASPGQVEGLTDEERALYDDLVARIEGNKDHMFDVIAGKATTTPAVAGSDAPAHHPEDGMDAGASEPAAEKGSDDAGRPTGATENPAASGPSASSSDEAATASEPSESADDRAPDVAAAEASAVAGPDEAGADGDGVSAADVMGEEPATEEEPSSGDPATDGSGVAAQSTAAPAEAVPAGGASGQRASAGTADAAEDTDDVDRTTVRITDEVGEIFGVDQREYRLGEDDVVTLPTANAEPLLDREAAERLD